MAEGVETPQVGVDQTKPPESIQITTSPVGPTESQTIEQAQSKNILTKIWGSLFGKKKESGSIQAEPQNLSQIRDELAQLHADRKNLGSSNTNTVSKNTEDADRMTRIDQRIETLTAQLPPRPATSSTGANPTQADVEGVEAQTTGTPTTDAEDSSEQKAA